MQHLSLEERKIKEISARDEVNKLTFFFCCCFFHWHHGRDMSQICFVSHLQDRATYHSSLLKLFLSLLGCMLGQHMASPLWYCPACSVDSLHLIQEVFGVKVPCKWSCGVCHLPRHRLRRAVFIVLVI